MTFLLAVWLSVAAVQTGAEPQMIGFACEAKDPTDPEAFVWHYTFEVDRKTGKGTWGGLTYGGLPFEKDIEVVFTPARMQIRELGKREFFGYIDRKTLRADLGGAAGPCKMVPVKKRERKF